MGLLFAIVVAVCSFALIAWIEHGISLTVLWFVGPALLLLPFGAARAVDAVRDRLPFGVSPEHAPDDDVQLSPGARRFLRERGNRLWIWPGEEGLLAADLRPESTEQFQRMPLASGVEAYVARSVAASAVEPVRVRSQALVGLTAEGWWEPQPSALEVLVSPFARGVIRRNGNRVWIWMNDNYLACAGFSPPTTREPYVRFDLGQGQEAYVSEDLERRVHYLAVGLWPFRRPWVSATVNNRD